MINITLKFPKFPVFEYDSRRGHIPNNLATLNKGLREILGTNLRRDFALFSSVADPVVVYSKENRVFMTKNYVIMYTIQKFSKKRIDSGKKRLGDQGKNVTKFIVAYGSHVVVRCYLIPKKVLKSYFQHPKHFVAELYSYDELVKVL